MDPIEESFSTPLDCIYSSYEEAYNAFKTNGIENGYGIRLHLSRLHRSNIKTYFFYRCDNSRIYRTQAIIRETRTRAIGCPFSVVIT
jgi:hypothetical protein